MTPTAVLRRRSAAAPWTLAAESALATPDGEAPTPLEVLEADTLLGLLALGLLPLLATELAAPSAAAAALLAAAAARGPAVAAAVADCAPLLRAMRTTLLAGAAPSSRV